MKVAVIGGGASGIACAVGLKRKDKSIEVTVYEKLPRILKKILVTGNGRCNLTNANSSARFYRGDKRLVLSALNRYPFDSTLSFFGSMGLITRTEAEGRVYPASSQAASVVSVLLNEAEENGVEIVTDTEIKSIEKKGNGYLLNGKYRADSVVIAAGGCAAKSQGTDGASFRLLGALGVKVQKPHPALSGVTVKGFPKSLKGVRSKCTVSLYRKQNLIYSETGEIQFNDYGVSGIPVMQLSGLINEKEKDSFALTVDFLPDFDRKYISSFFSQQAQTHPQKTAELMMSGLLPKTLGNYLLLEAGIKKDRPSGEIDKAETERLIGQIKEKIYVGLGVRGFEYAQVTAGGVGSDEVNPETLELYGHKGIYVVGEALDVDGLCGGHNLQFAWSTGRIAADSIVGEK